MFLKERTDIGALYETFIATEIIKRGHELRYWRTKAGAEVDFFLEKPEGLTAIECKTTIDSPKITKSLRSFIEKYNPSRVIVLSKEFKGKSDQAVFDTFAGIIRYL